MKTLLLVVALGLATACASSRPPERETPRAALATAAAPAMLEREVRYYRDEAGGVWDDRGRKLDRIPAGVTR